MKRAQALFLSGIVLSFWYCAAQAQEDATPLADLVVKEILIDYPQIQSGAEEARVMFTVKNQGMAPAGVFYCSLNTNPSVSVLPQIIPMPLMPGQEVQDSFTIGQPALWSPDRYYLSVTADCFRTVPESNDNNNTSVEIPFEITQNKPDIIIKDISVTKTAIQHGSQGALVTFVVENAGDAPVEKPFTCGISVSPAIAAANIAVEGGLRPGEERSVGFQVGHDAVWPPDRYSLSIWADIDNIIEESNENNNSSSPVEFQIVRDMPDLVIEDISIDKDMIPPNSGGAWIKYRLKNQGAGNAESPGGTDGSPMIYVQCTATTTPPADPIERNPHGSFLGPGQELYDSFSVGEGWQPGRYRLTIIADSDMRIAESDENNNVSQEISFEVLGPLPDLVVRNCAIRELNSVSGVRDRDRSIGVDFTVRNEGVGPVPPERVTTYQLLIVPLPPESQRFPFTIQKNDGLLQPGQEASHGIWVDYLDPENLWRPGVYGIRVKANSDNAIIESKSDNNTSEEVRFEVPVPPKPDLVVKNISINNIRIPLGSQETRVSVTVKNNGPGRADGPIVSTVQSVPPVKASATIERAIQPGEEASCQIPVGSGEQWQPGKYRLSVMVDGVDAIEEKNEKNNASGEIQFEIVSPREERPPAKSPPRLLLRPNK